jgi:hypothetical protein
MVTVEGIAMRTYDVSDFQRGSQVMVFSAGRWSWRMEGYLVDW